MQKSTKAKNIKQIDVKALMGEGMLDFFVGACDFAHYYMECVLKTFTRENCRNIMKQCNKIHQGSNIGL